MRRCLRHDAVADAMPARCWRYDAAITLMFYAMLIFRRRYVQRDYLPPAPFECCRHSAISLLMSCSMFAILRRRYGAILLIDADMPSYADAIPAAATLRPPADTSFFVRVYARCLRCRCHDAHISLPPPRFDRCLYCATNRCYAPRCHATFHVFGADIVAASV